jgi:hypothetical protein
MDLKKFEYLMNKSAKVGKVVQIISSIKLFSSGLAEEPEFDQIH